MGQNSRVFRTGFYTKNSKIKKSGTGAFTMYNIERDMPILIYKGTKRNHEEQLEIEKTWDKKTKQKRYEYMFTLNLDRPESERIYIDPWPIDMTMSDSVPYMINEPPIGKYANVESVERENGEVWIYSTRDIKAFDELYMCYGINYERDYTPSCPNNGLNKINYDELDDEIDEEEDEIDEEEDEIDEDEDEEEDLDEVYQYWDREMIDPIIMLGLCYPNDSYIENERPSSITEPAYVRDIRRVKQLQEMFQHAKIFTVCNSLKKRNSNENHFSVSFTSSRMSQNFLDIIRGKVGAVFLDFVRFPGEYMERAYGIRFMENFMSQLQPGTPVVFPNYSLIINDIDTSLFSVEGISARQYPLFMTYCGGGYTHEGEIGKLDNEYPFVVVRRLPPKRRNPRRNPPPKRRKHLKDPLAVVKKILNNLPKDENSVFSAAAIGRMHLDISINNIVRYQILVPAVKEFLDRDSSDQHPLVAAKLWVASRLNKWKEGMEKLRQFLVFKPYSLEEDKKGYDFNDMVHAYIESWAIRERNIESSVPTRSTIVKHAVQRFNNELKSMQMKKFIVNNTRKKTISQDESNMIYFVTHVFVHG